MAEGAEAQDFPRIHDEEADAGSEEQAHPFAAGKADLQKRFIALIIDAVAAVLVGFIPWIGGLIATAYWLVRDGLEVEWMDRRSVGKKLMKLRPVTATGAPMDIETSIKRNWPLALTGLVQLLLFVPILGWLLMIPLGFIALAVGLFEIFLVVTDESGRRFGDKFADTMVVEVDD